VFRDMNRQLMIKLLRHLRVLNIADSLYYYKIAKLYGKDNRKFGREHLDMAISPDKMLFEILGNNSFRGYWDSGLIDAEWLTNIIKRNTNGDNIKIAEWGCGVARVTRQIKYKNQSCLCF